MATVQEIMQMKVAIQQLSRQLGQIEGREKQLQEQIAQAGFKTLKEAEKALPTLKKRLDKMQRECDELYAQFHREYTHRLGSDQG